MSSSVTFRAVSFSPPIALTTISVPTSPAPLSSGSSVISLVDLPFIFWISSVARVDTCSATHCENQSDWQVGASWSIDVCGVASSQGTLPVASAFPCQHFPAMSYRVQIGTSSATSSCMSVMDSSRSRLAFLTSLSAACARHQCDSVGSNCGWTPVNSTMDIRLHPLRLVDVILGGRLLPHLVGQLVVHQLGLLHVVLCGSLLPQLLGDRAAQRAGHRGGLVGDRRRLIGDRRRLILHRSGHRCRLRCHRLRSQADVAPRR
mmetsp:Transcript_33166/g.104353  ORF Transcript_33166/g.104353 Transcript_33166/m.104353 type:complete len:261 (-) Transcript_33166:402-1184(-)